MTSHVVIKINEDQRKVVNCIGGNEFVPVTQASDPVIYTILIGDFYRQKQDLEDLGYDIEVLNEFENANTE
jgi:hypothetical protein